MHFDLHNVGDRLQKKLGPLPVWAWALIIVGVGYGVYHFTIGKNASVGSASDATTSDAIASDSTPLDTSVLPPASGSGGGGGYVPDTGATGTTYVPPLTLPYDNSAQIGLGSYGYDYGMSDYPPVINDTPTPNLATPTVTTKPSGSQIASLPKGTQITQTAAQSNAVASNPSPGSETKMSSAQVQAAQQAGVNAAAAMAAAAAAKVAQAQANNAGVAVGTVRAGPNGRMNRWTGTSWVPV